jgi:hypothetical protein
VFHKLGLVLNRMTIDLPLRVLSLGPRGGVRSIADGADSWLIAQSTLQVWALSDECPCHIRMVSTVDVNDEYRPDSLGASTGMCSV